MSTQVALLQEERLVAPTDFTTPVPIDVTVLSEDRVQLSLGVDFPSDVGFDPETGAITLPVGSYSIDFSIVTPGASFKNPALLLTVGEGSGQTFVGIPPVSSTLATLTTRNALQSQDAQKHQDYTLLCIGSGGQDEPHDPTIIYEPPGG